MQGEAEGILCLRQSWPAQFRTLYGDHKRYEEAYFSSYKVPEASPRAAAHG